MLDSFYHASHGVLFGEAPGVIPQPESMNALEAWAKYWYRSGERRVFLASYLATPGVAALLPQNRRSCAHDAGFSWSDLALRSSASS